jgi:hypothetical protein
MRSGITNTNGNERRKHDDWNKDVYERKPPFQITDDQQEHLQQLCNETRTDGRKVEKTSDYISPP